MHPKLRQLCLQFVQLLCQVLSGLGLQLVSLQLTLYNTGMGLTTGTK